VIDMSIVNSVSIGPMVQAAAIVCISASSALLPPHFVAQNAVPQQSPIIQSRVPSSMDGPVQLTDENLGDLYMVRNRYEAAAKSYMQAEPKTPQIWNKLGIAYQQMYNMELARRSYKVSLRLNPNSSDVVNNMGTVYYSLRDFKTAERYYRKAIKMSPASALLYKNLGTDLLAEDKFQKGWECYQTALSIDPNIFEKNNNPHIGEPTSSHNLGALNYFLAKSYANLGQKDRAIEYLRLAIDEGFINRKKVLADKEFASLHGFDAFEELVSDAPRQ
jgi:tetratricopeptide (TPR) repeat protein